MNEWCLTLITECAHEVHAELGGGLSEHIYQNALACALRARGTSLTVETEVAIPVTFKGTYVGFVRADLVVNKCIVLELKAVAKVTEAHLVQLRTYLKWVSPLINAAPTQGLVINFGALHVEIHSDAQVD